MVKPGDKVWFGRSHGEKTLGTVLKVNAKSIMVRQDESRGTMRSYPVGTKWRVAHSMVSPATEAAPSEATKSRRPESTILREILGVYAALSPENLTCDGEASREWVVRRRTSLNRTLRALEAELGRKVSETEAWSHYKETEFRR